MEGPALIWFQERYQKLRVDLYMRIKDQEVLLKHNQYGAAWIITHDLAIQCFLVRFYKRKIVELHTAVGTQETTIVMDHIIEETRLLQKLCNWHCRSVCITLLALKRRRVSMLGWCDRFLFVLISRLIYQTRNNFKWLP